MRKFLLSILIFSFLFSEEYPSPVNVNSYVSDGNIEIEWSEIILNNITGYRVYRNSNELLLTSESTYTDRQIDNDVPYCYTVTALYNNSIESEHSNMSCTSWQINPPIEFSINPDDESVYLQWEEPITNQEEFLLSYHNGNHGNGIGTYGNLDFDAVMRFTPEQLANTGITDNYFLSQISIIPNSEGTIIENCELTIKVWTGGNDNNGYNPGTLILEQEVYSPELNEWNNIQLNTPLQISLNEEIWIGYNIKYQGVDSESAYPAGTDTGPAVTGYGDLIAWPSLNDDNSHMYDENGNLIHIWYSMGTSWGLNYNWMIQGLFSTSTGESRIISNLDNNINSKIQSRILTPTNYIPESIINPNHSISNERLPDMRIDNINVWNTNSNREFSSYDIYRNGQLLTNYSDEYLFYSDQTVENLNEYCYSIIANYTQGESSSTEILCTIPSPGPPATNLDLFNYGNPIKLTWSNPNQGELGTRILRDGYEHDVTNNAIYYDSENLFSGQEYCYQIQSIYESSFTFPTNEQCITYELYSPSNLELMSGNGSISLSWDNIGINLNEIEIYRDNQFLVSINDNHYIDFNVSQQQDYCYQLVSIYDNGRSDTVEVCGASYYYQPPNEEVYSGVSSVITIDMIAPEIEVLSPFANQTTTSGAELIVSWNSEDLGGFSHDAINIYLSTSTVPSNFERIAISNNDQSEGIFLPDIQSENCQIMIKSTDYYGNSSIAYSSGLFTITNDSNNMFSIISESQSSISSYFVIDQTLPSVNWTYPNDNEEFEGGSTIYPQWDADDESFDGEDIDIYLSESNGSEYNSIASNIPHNGLAGITLPNISTTTASFKIIITDAYGNSSNDYQESFISITNIEDEPLEIITETNSGTTEAFIIDQVPPTVEWIYPNGGESFNSNDMITTLWEANDSHFDSTDVSILLSPQSGMEFELVGDNVPNSGEHTIILPDINSETAQFKLFAIDAFGNVGTEDFSDGFFSIGSIDNEFEVNSESNSGSSNLFTIDQIPPSVSLLYPNGGEHLVDYEEANIRFDLTEDNNQGTKLQVWVSHEIGGWYVNVGDHYNADNGDTYVDLSVDGAVPERLYGFLKIQATDYFGNTSNHEYSDNYFILGDPKGDINLNFIDEEQNTLLIDWSWVDNQTIAITEEALQNLADHQLGVEYIKIFDENGIHSTSCSDDSISINTGLVELAHINMNEMSIKTISMMAGADYCALGGSRTIGYNPNGQSHVKIIAGASHNDYELIPHVPQLVNEAMMFDHSTHIITDFDIGRTIEVNNNQILSVDDRDIDNFNVYSRITNHSGSITRNCNNNGICEEGEAIANCFEDCCSIPGTDANDEWCFEQNIQGLTNYYTNLSNNLYLPNNQGSATINYRIWLLDQNGVEAVVTLDTEGIDFEGDGDLTTIYEQELGAGWNWFSFNVYLEDMNVNSVFSQFTESEWQCDYGGSDTNCPYYIKSQSAYGIYYQGYGFYPEFTMNIEEFYKLQMNAPSQILFQGILAEPQNTPINLNSGWNWIGYVPLDPLNVNIGLSNIIENNTPYYIKSQSAYGIFYENFGFYPEFTMESHGGYMLQMIEPDILTYPTTSRNSSVIENIAEINSIKDIWSINYRDFEYSASATFKIDIDDLKITENDYIALFDENTCIGIAKGEICPINNELLFSMLFYNNEEVSNNLTIEYFNQSENMIFNINESINFINDSNIGDIYNPIILTRNYTPEAFILNPAYPNPFNPMTTISFEIPDEINFVELSIYDLNGKKVENLFKGDLNKGQYKYDWNAKNYSSGIYFVKIISNNKQLTQKITLIK